MKKLFLILPLYLVLLSACHNNKMHTDELQGTVTDVTGLDGCGIVIKLDNGTTLQPIVLPQGFQLQKDKRVRLRYKVLKDRMTTCMNGTTAEIISINYL